MLTHIKKAPLAPFLNEATPYVRHSAGTYFDNSVPAVAAVFALVLPADLQIQLIEPAVGTVPAAKATPEAVLPSTGVRVSVFAVDAATAVVYVIVIAPVVALMATLATFLVAAGEVQPEAKGAAFAAFSAIAVFADPASAKPSVTLARTV